jgi:hypothetical protein
VQKALNAAAIQTAWNTVSLTGGIILIPGKIEVGSNVINLGDNTSRWINNYLVGLGPDTSQIISASTTNVIDAVGRNQLTIRDLGIVSSTAQSGILFARNATSPSSGRNRLENVWIVGTYSKACLIGIAAESMRLYNPHFENTGSPGRLYYTSQSNETIAATTINGTIQDSSNTDIYVYGGEFYNVSDNAILVELERAAQITFQGTSWIAGSPTTGSRLLQLTAPLSTHIFNGPVGIYGGIFEGSGPNGSLVYFNGAPGAIDYFYGITMDTVAINPYNAGATVFGYSSDNVYVYNLSFKNNKLSDVGYGTIHLRNLGYSFVEHLSQEGDLEIDSNRAIINSELSAKSYTWGAGSYHNKSIIKTQGISSLSISIDSDVEISLAGKGIILRNAADNVIKRVRLNDAGDGLIYEAP